MKIQLLLDNGIGLGGSNINQLKNGVRSLIEALPPGVEVTIVTTAPQPRFLVRATTDRQAMLKGLDLLAADTSSGTFVDSLTEAVQRIEKDKSNHFPVIISAATTAGDRTFLERPVQRAMQTLRQRSAIVYIVVVAGGPSAGGGVAQGSIGPAVADLTRGRYQETNAPTLLATLLPEFGALAVKAHESKSHLFRLTVERPAGASGELGKISVRSRADLNVSDLTLDEGTR
jgi:hypothetical protein